MNSAVKYGGVVAIALFLSGWVTGLAGSFLPNLLFSLVMGVFAGCLFALVQKFAAKQPRK